MRHAIVLRAPPLAAYGQYFARSVRKPHWPAAALSHRHPGTAGMDLYRRTAGAAEGFPRRRLGTLEKEKEAARRRRTVLGAGEGDIGVNTGSQAGLFPALASAEAFRAWRTDRSQWLPAATGIARDLALPCDSIEAFSTGTNLVVALDDRLILKLFPPMFRSQFVSEHTSLALLDGRLSVPIPKILFKGEREQWPYLVITRLDGILGTEAWPRLPEDQKENVLGQIGETIAEVQRAPIGDLAHLEPNWKQFIAGQIEGCRARHQRLGLPPKYLAGLDELLRQAPALIPMHAAPVILIGEYIPENILLSCHSGDWKLSGLF